MDTINKIDISTPRRAQMKLTISHFLSQFFSEKKKDNEPFILDILLFVPSKTIYNYD